MSPARDETAGYVAWGHSTVVNPWGEILGRADSGEETIYVDIDLVIPHLETPAFWDTALTTHSPPFHASTYFLDSKT